MGIYGITNRNRATTSASDDAPEPRITRVIPDSVGLDSHDLERIAPLVERYVERGVIPGAVVAIVRDDKLAYLEAFGSRSEGVPMTTDTHFDVASLTKPVVVATSVMQHVERGELRLSERVDRLMPGFEGWRDHEGELHDVTLLDIMTHTSMLPPYVSLERLTMEYPDSAILSRDLLMDYIAHCDREITDTEGASRYSCLNYITLGAIVEHVAKMPLDDYARINIFEPLGMCDTRFTPDGEYAAMCAPTSTSLCGVAHDPLAREIMNGVSGNAGLFSTAEDLAIFSAMLLNGGLWRDAEILSPLAVETLFRIPHGYEASNRTPGWKVARTMHAAAGDLLVGDDILIHTGATGTSITISKSHNLAIIILTNRTLGSATATDIHDLRSKVCNIVASAVNFL